MSTIAYTPNATGKALDEWRTQMRTRLLSHGDPAGHPEYRADFPPAPIEAPAWSTGQQILNDCDYDLSYADVGFRSETFTFGEVSGYVTQGHTIALTEAGREWEDDVEREPYIIARTNADGDIGGPLPVMQDAARVLQKLIQQAQIRPKTRRSTRGDDAITQEIQALIGDRDLERKQAAELFGMTETKLTHRFGGHSSWTLVDVEQVARGLTETDEEMWDMITRFVRLGLDMEANGAATQRELVRYRDVDEHLQLADV